MLSISTIKNKFLAWNEKVARIFLLFHSVQISEQTKPIEVDTFIMYMENIEDCNFT